MLDKLGAVGVVGFLLMLGGVSVLYIADPLIAAGVAIIVAGLGMVAYGLVSNVMRALGFTDMT